MTQRLWVSAVAVGVVITALFWVDALFIPLALLGPVISGVLTAWRATGASWPRPVTWPDGR